MNARNKTLRSFLMLVILIVSIQACATGRVPRRGRLSDAMDKASDQNKGPRTVRTQEPYRRPSSPPRYEEHTKVEKDESYDRSYPIQGDSLPDNTADKVLEKSDGSRGVNPIGLSGGLGLLKGDDFSKMIDLELSFGFAETKYSRSEIYIGAAWAGVDRASELDSSIDNGVFLMSLGANYKRKILENTKWNAPYFLCGAAYKKMWWAYENTITTTDGDRIRSDSLGGLEFKVGLGQNLIKVDEKKFGIEVFPSVIFWLSPTDEGFDNDVFEPFFMLNFRAVFSSW